MKKVRAKEKLKKILLQNGTSTSNNQTATTISESRATTPSSDSSSTRAMLDEMIILSENESLRSASDLPHDTMTLNTVEVEKIIEQIVTDIEDLSSSDDEDFELKGKDGEGAGADEDEFGEEAANAGIPRYFLENSGPKCFNCGQSGHVLKDCPAGSTIPCHLCGEVGHTRFHCPQEMCYNCGRPGHHSRDCPQKRRRRVFGDETCNRCGQPGHLSRECSMCWRGYVFARDLPRKHADFVEELRTLRKRCYNCASISHFGDDCPSARRPFFSVFHLPEYDYLDQVILGIKKAKHESNERKDKDKDKAKPNAKTNSHSKSSANSNSNAKQTPKSPTKSKQPHPSHSQQNQAKPQPLKRPMEQSSSNPQSSSNRKVFMESRGFTPDSPTKRNRFSDSEAEYSDQEGKNQAFVEYGAERRVQVVVAKRGDDGEEEQLRKGASSMKNKPSYRGGYK